MHLDSNVTLNSMVCILLLNSTFYVTCLQFSSSFTDVRMCIKRTFGNLLYYRPRTYRTYRTYRTKYTITVTDIQRRIYFTDSTIQDIDKVCAVNFFFTYVISNEGVGYDAYTGIYTVPQNGVYPLRSLLASFDYWSIAKIVVNGVPKVGIHAAIPSIMLMNCWQHSYSFFTTGRPFLDCTCPWWRSIISIIPHFRDIFGVN